MTNKPGPFSPIGIFDSGPGGLAVLQQVRRLLPFEDVLYFGDTARQPYGPQPVENVRRYALEITSWLASQGVKLIIIGCNTASVAGRQAAQALFPDLPVYGMIEPAVQAALRVSPSRRIGVWGTEITVESKAYDSLILAEQPGAQVLGAGCPELLRLAEKGQVDNKSQLKDLAAAYYRPLAAFGIDTLVLGCTDLTCVRDVIDETVAPGVKIVDPAEEVTLFARQYLSENSLLHPTGNTPPQYRFSITGKNLAEFSHFTAQFMGMPEVDVTQIDLDQIQRAFLTASSNPTSQDKGRNG